MDQSHEYNTYQYNIEDERTCIILLCARRNVMASSEQTSFAWFAAKYKNIFLPTYLYLRVAGTQ